MEKNYWRINVIVFLCDYTIVVSLCPPLGSSQYLPSKHHDTMFFGISLRVQFAFLPFFFGAWFFWCVGPFCFWFIRRNLRALGGLFHGVTWRTKPIRTSNLSARRSLTWVIGSRWALIWWINLWASQFGRRTSHSHLSYLVRFRSEDGDGSKPYPPGEHQN